MVSIIAILTALTMAHIDWYIYNINDLFTLIPLGVFGVGSVLYILLVFISSYYTDSDF